MSKENKLREQGQKIGFSDSYEISIKYSIVSLWRNCSLSLERKFLFINNVPDMNCSAMRICDLHTKFFFISFSTILCKFFPTYKVLALAKFFSFLYRSLVNYIIKEECFSLSLDIFLFPIPISVKTSFGVNSFLFISHRPKKRNSTRNSLGIEIKTKVMKKMLEKFIHRRKWLNELIVRMSRRV